MQIKTKKIVKKPALEKSNQAIKNNKEDEDIYLKIMNQTITKEEIIYKKNL